jgi:hypothetical protein
MAASGKAGGKVFSFEFLILSCAITARPKMNWIRQLKIHN